MSQISQSAWERHLQTALAAIIIGAVGWVGVTVTGNREEIARIQERQTHLTDEVGEVRRILENRTIPIAKVQDNALKIADHESRIRALEKLMGKRP